MDMQELMSRAAVADVFQNPATLLAVSEMGKRGQQEMIDFVMADVLRSLRQEPGPVVFPTLRQAVISAIKGAKHSAPVGAAVSGVGDEPYAGLPYDPTAGQYTTTAAAGEKAGATEASSSGFDWAKFAAGMINTIATVGTNLYLGHEQIEAQKDQLALTQQQLTAVQQSSAAQQAAYRQQQAAMAQQSALPSGAAFPGWLIPVGVGALGLVVAVSFLKKR